jgi:hypothetical protein
VAAGIDVVHTSDILGLSGLLVGGSVPIAGSFRGGIVLGRIQVRDLVRTTTSPDSEDGSIPVYEQMGGAQLAFQSSVFDVGALFAAHHARFDVESETGFTFDVGLRAYPIPRLTIAAATHFFPITLAEEPTTEYNGGAEYAILDRSLLGGFDTRLVLRYGATYRTTGEVDHMLSTGMSVGDQVYIDAAITSESQYERRDWRPAVSVGLRFGKYSVQFSHGSGINDVGGTYRVGLDIEFPR